MDELNIGIREVSSNIQGVSQVAQESGEGIQQIHQASSELAEMAVRLQDLTKRFTLE